MLKSWGHSLIIRSVFMEFSVPNCYFHYWSYIKSYLWSARQSRSVSLRSIMYKNSNEEALPSPCVIISPCFQGCNKTTTHFMTFLSMYLNRDSVKWSDVRRNAEKREESSLVRVKLCWNSSKRPKKYWWERLPRRVISPLLSHDARNDHKLLLLFFTGAWMLPQHSLLLSVTQWQTPPGNMAFKCPRVCRSSLLGVQVEADGGWHVPHGFYRVKSQW